MTKKKSIKRLKTYHAKYVYWITSHKEPEQVYNLVKTIRKLSKNALIIVHHDSRSSQLEENKVEIDDLAVIFPFNIPVQWGGSSRILMHLKCIDWIINNVEFEWITLISGQDYPIKSLADFEHLLSSTEYEAFISYMAVKQRHLLERYKRYYFKTPWPLKSSLGLRGLRIIDLIVPGLIMQHTMVDKLSLPRIRTVFNRHFLCYKGEDWFTLSKKATELLSEHAVQHKEIKNYYLTTAHASESYFHSILVNSGQLKLCNNHLRYMIWPKQGSTAHPKTLNNTDITNMKQSNCFFARKFDWIESRETITMVDKSLLAVKGDPL